MAKGGRRKKHDEGHTVDERWLVSFADMMTLLFCLFMVLFSISSVNTSRFESLQKSLDEAFSGAVLPGGKGIMSTGNSEEVKTRAQATPPIPALKMVTPENPNESNEAKALRAEDENFKQLKSELDSFAERKEFKGKIKTELTARGLVITVLTDKLLFGSGDADISSSADGLIAELVSLVNRDAHKISVEGHTDSQPIADSQFPSNWELSTARATAILRAMASRGVTERRFEAAGYADLHPVADNSSAEGRSRNRRVEIVLLRRSQERHGSALSP